MKAFVFVGLLACLSFASADSKFNTTAEEVRLALTEIDPATVSSLELTLFNRIKVSLTSASLANFSTFAFPVLVDDGSNIVGIFRLSNIAANLNNLYVDHGNGNIGQIPDFDASINGVNVDLSASYTTSPLRLTSFSSLLQLRSISVSGTRIQNGNSTDITVSSNAVERFNHRAVELQDQISTTLMAVANEVLSIIYP